jgi:hypothetical protein
MLAVRVLAMTIVLLAGVSQMNKTKRSAYLRASALHREGIQTG